LHCGKLEDWAPHYSMIGDKNSNWVCREAKPAAVYIPLLKQYYLEGETVLDFFLGGQALNMSLLKGRKCLAIVDSERIRQFLDVYTESLVAIP
jgi:hypothetical protein